MADVIYSPPRQMIKECQFLEKNYLNCLLQKALKDQTNTNQCNLEQVLFFHVECPDYLKKYDDPVEGPAFLKRQMYNLLAFPYFNHKHEEKKKEVEKRSSKNELLSGRYLQYEGSAFRGPNGNEFSLFEEKI
jgi:hypothetical protein